MLTRQGYELEITDSRVAKIKRELRVAPIDRSGIQQRPKYFDVWWTHGTMLVVPRFWASEHLQHPKHTPERFDRIDPICVPFAATLRDDLDQPNAVTATLQKMNECGGAVLSLGTGQGKTVCACYIISQLAVKTVVLVHKDVLKTQWAERIAQFLPTAKVSYIQGSVCDTSGDVVIAMLQTLVSRKYPASTWSAFGLLIVDECHHIAAETFSTAMRGLCCRYSLGLSATPERKDGLTKVVHWFMGPQAYAAQRSQMRHVVVELPRYTCPRYRLPPPMTRTGVVNFSAIVTEMAEDQARTEFITGWIRTLLEDGRTVLVLSHRRDHCIDIARRIPGAVTFLGGAKKKSCTDDDHLSARVVVATFALASEGYDDPRLDALVLATPCADVTQAAGRILRGSASNKNPIIVDIQDDFSVAYAQAAKRKCFYRDAGFTYASQVHKDYPKCVIID